ncbi:DEAD/DEAH box helicase [Salmonella enterica]|nr:DEAD/DEAH box helicase [Salmonella enterica]EIJ2978569.1 DEAD/DEAH box helicase [Salmonella enterica]
MQLTITPNFAQERALNMLRRDWKSHNTFMVYAPTGSGKTGLAAFIVAGFVSRGMRVLFCAPYTILIGQTANRFVEYGLPGDDIGYIWADHPNYDPDRKIQIASADTLIRRVFPDNIDLLIIDEAHLRKKRILQDIERLRASGELIQRGDLSKYEFYAPTKPDLKGVKTRSSLEYGNDYNETQLAEIMCGSTLVGDIVQNWLENGRDLPTIAFCVNVAHANYLTIQFNLVGVNAEVMTADTPVDERQTIIHRFETGATKIIVSVGVLVAGFDSDVRCIIYARPTKSEIRWLQALGRGLRTAPGKESCLIFDHSGTVHRLGYPDSIEYDDLPGKSDGMEESARRAVEERAEKLPHECSQCHYMKPAGVYVCPKCGHKPLGGEDVDTDTGRKLTKLGKNQHLPTKAEKQAWWSQIKFYQRQRVSQGKKPVSDAWCAHTFREKFGEWPNDLSDFPMEITPEVSNYIRHKLIRYAKGKGKAAASAETASPIPDSDITHKVISAKRQVENIRSMLGRRTA